MRLGIVRSNSADLKGACVYTHTNLMTEIALLSVPYGFDLFLWVSIVWLGVVM